MTITFDRIRIAAGAIIIPVPFTLYYKQISAVSWTIIDSNVYVDADGYILSSPLPSISEPPGYYVLRAVNDYCGIDYIQGLMISTDNAFEWVEDTSYCEQDEPFTQSSVISGFADPVNLGYDTATGRMYVADMSAVTSGSNVYYFDTSTITTSTDVVPVGSINKSIHISVIDMEDRKIYLTGSDSGGVIRYDIANNSVSTLACGVDVSWPNYNRITLVKNGNILISISFSSTTLYIIDTTTFTITDTVPFSSIPSYTQYFSSGNIIMRVNGEWWVLASQGAQLGANGSGIARYNNNFSTLIGVISLPGQVTWTNSAYWRSVKIIDNYLYIIDLGSNQLLRVNLNTLSVTSIYTFTNRQGKSHVALSIIVDPITQDVFVAGDLRNDINTDLSPIKISYQLNKTTFLPEYIYPNTAFGFSLIRYGVTSKLFGSYAGYTVYSQANPSVAPVDGTISIIDRGGTDNNTGTKIVLSLKEINSLTGIPTGQIKENNPTDPDYKPQYQDLYTCPVTYTLECPVATYTVTGSVAEYEFSILKSTYSNPLLVTFRINQVDTVTSTLLNSIDIPKNTYQHSTLTKVGSNPNRVDLLFLDSSNNVIHTCANLFTF